MIEDDSMEKPRETEPVPIEFPLIKMDPMLLFNIEPPRYTPMAASVPIAFPRKLILPNPLAETLDDPITDTPLVYVPVLHPWPVKERLPSTTVTQAPVK